MFRCFVIQPFDKGEFDQRFDEVISPAIDSAKLEPYRVDRDPNTTILYKDIQKGIDNAAVCLADITTDNPNVWFELGYALAREKEVVIICCEGRLKFPFDIQHRSIIEYKKNSPSDFEEMQGAISGKLKAALDRHVSKRDVGEISAVKTTEGGLSPHEINTLVIIASESIIDETGMSGYQLANAMENAGYNKMATKLSLVALEKRNFITCEDVCDEMGNNYLGYKLLIRGQEWLLANQSKIELKHERPNRTMRDDIPF